MNTSTVEETRPAAQGGIGSVGTPSPPAAPPKARQTAGGGLYRVIWRWHFYAGMIIVPTQIVVAATGALYVFKDELEGLIYPGVRYVEPARLAAAEGGSARPAPR